MTPERTCLHCGAHFHSQRPREVCSKRCRSNLDARLRRERNPYWGHRYDATCAVCSVAFKTKHTPTEQKKGRGKYCSIECMSVGLSGPTHPCPHCGWSIPVHRPYCDRRCRKRARAQQRLDDAARGQQSGMIVTHGRCRECGETFTVRRTRVVALCSDTCSKRVSRRRLRARDRSAFVEPVFREQVFIRDRWRCQLCGKSLDRKRVVPHPRAPVVDHVVPLAEGGEHSMLNVQAAHFLCNSVKGAGCIERGEQLRIIA